jgi:hypothetical protein
MYRMKVLVDFHSSNLFQRLIGLFYSLTETGSGADKR